MQGFWKPLEFVAIFPVFQFFKAKPHKQLENQRVWVIKAKFNEVVTGGKRQNEIVMKRPEALDYELPL